MKPSPSSLKFLTLYFLALAQSSYSLTISLHTSTSTPTPSETSAENDNSTELFNPIIQSNKIITINPIIQPIIENSTFHTSQTENGTTTTPTSSLNQTEPSTFTQEPGVQKLTQVINDTILSINELIASSMHNVSRQGQHFKKVADILQNMQNFLSARSTIISQDVETNLERELQGIQSFIGENQQQFQNLSNPNKNLSQIHILQVGIEPESQNKSHDLNATTGNTRTAKGGPQSGMVKNFMQFSSKVGEGIRSSIEGAENIVTDSLTQIQNQIQNFLNGITNFFTKNPENSLLSSKRLFNLSRNGLQNPPFMFRRQQVISQ